MAATIDLLAFALAGNSLVRHCNSPDPSNNLTKSIAFKPIFL